VSEQGRKKAGKGVPRPHAGAAKILIFEQGDQTGRQRDGGLKSAIFDQYLSVSEKLCKIGS